jgi:hypothetical protein
LRQVGQGTVDGFGTGRPVVAEKIAILQPDHLATAEERESLKSFVESAEGSKRFAGVVDLGIDCFVIHAAQFLAPLLEKLTGPLLDGEVVVALDEADGSGRDGGGRPGHAVTRIRLLRLR